jgi:hypothetical protein
MDRLVLPDYIGAPQAGKAFRRFRGRRNLRAALGGRRQPARSDEALGYPHAKDEADVDCLIAANHQGTAYVNAVTRRGERGTSLMRILPGPSCLSQIGS